MHHVYSFLIINKPQQASSSLRISFVFPIWFFLSCYCTLICNNQYQSLHYVFHDRETRRRCPRSRCRHCRSLDYAIINAYNTQDYDLRQHWHWCEQKCVALHRHWCEQECVALHWCLELVKDPGAVKWLYEHVQASADLQHCGTQLHEAQLYFFAQLSADIQRAPLQLRACVYQDLVQYSCAPHLQCRCRKRRTYVFLLINFER